MHLWNLSNFKSISLVTFPRKKITFALNNLGYISENILTFFKLKELTLLFFSQSYCICTSVTEILDAGMKVPK